MGRLSRGAAAATGAGTMRHAPGPIRAWTIQPWAVWAAVEATGSLMVDPHYSGHLHVCYEWLREQLARRIPGYTGNYPWWAYCRRPDLRRYRHRYALGAPYALIELALPPERACTLTFWAWDAIFYGRYLGATAAESEDWHRRLCAAFPDEEDGEPWPFPEPWRSERERSWERLFDPGLPAEGWWDAEGGSASEREVVFEELRRADVRRVTPFVGASPRRPPRTPMAPDEFALLLNPRSP